MMHFYVAIKEGSPPFLLQLLSLLHPRRPKLLHTNQMSTRSSHEWSFEVFGTTLKDVRSAGLLSPK